MKKKVCFYTLGCKVNQYETQIMREKFQQRGYIESGIKNANVIIINTCTVTSKSDAKSYSLIRRAVRESPLDSKIVVVGCLAELDKEQIKKIKGVDLVLKNKFKPVIVDAIEKDCVSSIKSEGTFSAGISYFKSHTRAFVKIQDGCGHNCSYCRISPARGKPRSKKSKDVLEEIETLKNNGYKEIVLTGVCLGAYGLDLDNSVNIIRLIKYILKNIRGEFRLRLSSIEPNYITNNLLDCIVESERICSHLHISLQSGDNRILELMNRGYNVEKILELVRYARFKDSKFSFSTDVIVGFPGETDASVKNTINILRKIQPVRTHIFKYSPRKNTLAYDFKSNITAYDKKRWHKQMIKVSDDMSEKYRSKFLEDDKMILVETAKNSEVAGYSDTYIYIQSQARDPKVNEFVKIKIKKITKNNTFGVII